MTVTEALGHYLRIAAQTDADRMRSVLSAHLGEAVEAIEFFPKNDGFWATIGTERQVYTYKVFE